MQKNNDSEIRENLVELIENFRKIRKDLNSSQKDFIKDRIKIFKTILKNPNAEYFFDENEEIQLGKIIWDNCRYCNADLSEIRDGLYPKISKNTERFCSKSCMIQFSKTKKIVDDYKADLVFWGKDFVKIIFYHRCSNSNNKKAHWPLAFELPVRSTRDKNFK